MPAVKENKNNLQFYRKEESAMLALFKEKVEEADRKRKLEREQFIEFALKEFPKL